MKERVGVVGAGLMGSEIALVYALAGHDVRLADRSLDQVGAALARLVTIVEDRERGIEIIGLSAADGAWATVGVVSDVAVLHEVDHPDRTIVHRRRRGQGEPVGRIDLSEVHFVTCLRCHPPLPSLRRFGEEFLQSL